MPGPVGLHELDLLRVTRLGAAIRRRARAAGSSEEAAGIIVRMFGESLFDRHGEHAVVLARLYVTVARRELPADVDAWLAKRHGAVGTHTTCLTLLATFGEEPDWCDRRRSQDHQAIPLPSPESVSRLPMVARLFTELGLPVRHLTQHDHLPLDPTRSFGVFHVHEARGSPYIPDQHRFVEPFGVRSVVGYGGSFADERLFAVILFLRTPIDREHAECFRLLSDATRDVLSEEHPRPLFQS